MVLPICLASEIRFNPNGSESYTVKAAGVTVMARTDRNPATSHRIKQLKRLTIAIQHQQIFIDPPLVMFMFGEKPESLTTKELTVVSLLSEGHKEPEIAEFLDIDTRLVEHHINCVSCKLKRANNSAMTSSN